MNRALRLAAAAATVAAAAASIALPVAPAGASSASCVGWAAMPASVAMTARQVVVHPVLRGTSGCTSAAHDYGASATLRTPTGAKSEFQQWSRFGARETVTFTVNVDRLGTYTMRAGDVQVYDSQEIRVPSSWHATTMVVKNGARFTSAHRTGSTVTAVLSRYNEFGWRAASGTRVALEQRHGSSWRIVARANADRSGAVTLRAPSGGSYRVVSASSTTTWSADATVR